MLHTLAVGSGIPTRLEAAAGVFRCQGLGSEADPTRSINSPIPQLNDRSTI
jgi:hypothetical protein